MKAYEDVYMMKAVALHPEGVDRNLNKMLEELEKMQSPSTRRAWIEITPRVCTVGTLTVALHPEGVDRNFSSKTSRYAKHVALHPEGVDRNFVTETV